MQRRTDVRTIESSITTPTGTARLVHAVLPTPIETLGAMNGHYLHLAVMPQVREAIGCFPDLWDSQRFVRLGEVFFLPSEHRSHIKSPRHLQQSVCCFFNPAGAERFFASDIEWTDSRLIASLDVSSTVIRDVLFRIGQELRAPGFDSEALIDTLMRLALIELSRYLLGAGNDEAGGGLAPWRLKRIDDRLRQSDRAPTLAELASLCHLSIRHLTRAFNVSRGRSIGSYIAESRIERAKLLLLTGMPVKHVAAQLNLTAASNLTAWFRRQTGETPRDFLTRKTRSQHSTDSEKSN